LRQSAGEVLPPSAYLLAAGHSVTVVLEFDSPSAAITYKARVLAVTGQR
jgi:hypothetical protein